MGDFTMKLYIYSGHCCVLSEITRGEIHQNQCHHLSRIAGNMSGYLQMHTNTNLHTSSSINDIDETHIELPSFKVKPVEKLPVDSLNLQP